MATHPSLTTHVHVTLAMCRSAANLNPPKTVAAAAVVLLLVVVEVEVVEVVERKDRGRGRDSRLDSLSLIPRCIALQLFRPHPAEQRCRPLCVYACLPPTPLSSHSTSSHTSHLTSLYLSSPPLQCRESSHEHSNAVISRHAPSLFAPFPPSQRFSSLTVRAPPSCCLLACCIHYIPYRPR